MPTFVGTADFYLVAIVPTDRPVNIRYTADTTAPVLTSLAAGMSVMAIGRTADNNWLQVILPDNRLGWVAAEVVVIDWNYVDSLPQVSAPGL